MAAAAQLWGCWILLALSVILVLPLGIVQSSSSSSSPFSSSTPPWRRGSSSITTRRLPQHNKDPSFRLVFATSTKATTRISSSSHDNPVDDDEAAPLLGSLPSTTSVDEDKVTHKETTTTTTTITTTRRRRPSSAPRMLAGMLGRFGGGILPSASFGVAGVSLLLLLLVGGSWKLSQYIILAHQQDPLQQNDTTISLSRYIAMCQDQLPHVWQHEILSNLELVHNEEEDHDHEEEQTIIHQALLENPALTRTLKRKVRPLMRQRMRLLHQAQAILDQHVVRRRRDNHNHNHHKNHHHFISHEDWKIWAEYHAEITVELYRLATQTLSERLESTTTQSTVSRPHLVQGLTHRLQLYCQAMHGGGSSDDSAQGLVVLDDHVLRTFFKEALKDAILPLPQPNENLVLQNNTGKPLAAAHRLQIVWNRTRNWIGHHIEKDNQSKLGKEETEGIRLEWRRMVGKFSLDNLSFLQATTAEVQL